MTNKNMDPELSARLDNFYKSVSSTADDIIYRIFPNKILDIQKRLEAVNSPTSKYHRSHSVAFTDTNVYPSPDSTYFEEPDLKKRKRAQDADVVNGAPHQVPGQYTGRMKANMHLQTVHGEIKAECEELASLCEKLRLWVNLTMPKIEDGDNFGVQIQEEVLSELHRAQESATNLRDGIRQHHLSRAKICSKIIKYPHIEDYSIALKEHDEKQLYAAGQNLHDLRHIYAGITDLIHKNIAKIRSPKGNNSAGLY